MRTRKQSEATKRKISAKLRGRKKSELHKARISEGLRRMWAQVPHETVNDRDNARKQ